ncbi:diguanylate cyclase [Methylophaga thiooxydans]|uniref:sensor domain-containing diguanylate cyclase n=1 Tax=Methylophaga thiooxydans TaxID=392484 RepID=UPI0023557198|nr:diguanylate cyclase [Methylophaga thiooxydans]
MLSFTRPIFWFCIAIITITTSSILLSAWWIGKQYSHEVAQAQITRADYYLQGFLAAQQAEQMTSVTGILSDYGFKRTIADGDPATIASMLDNHSQRVDLDLLLVFDRDGKPLSDYGSLIPATEASKIFSIMMKTPTEPRMMALTNGFYRLYQSPIKAPHIIGYAIAGKVINKERLEDIKLITGLDLTLHSKDKGYLLSTSSLANQVINDSLTQEPSASFWKRQQLINKQIDIESPPPYDVKLFMSADLTEFHSRFDRFGQTLVGVTLLLVVFIFLVSMVLSRRMFMPLQRLHKKLLRRASYDHLTGIHNRITANELGYRMLIECYRTEKPLLVALLDIDHFKDINDNYGHSAGDTILIEVANRLKRALRQYDVIGRFGGEEFIISCSMSREVGHETLIRLKKTISEKPFRYKDKLIPLTISIGACFIDFNQYARLLTPEELVEWADQALYASKDNGRNQITINHYKNGTLNTETIL